MSADDQVLNFRIAMLRRIREQFACWPWTFTRAVVQLGVTHSPTGRFARAVLSISYETGEVVTVSGEPSPGELAAVRAAVVDAARCCAADGDLIAARMCARQGWM